MSSPMSYNESLPTRDVVSLPHDWEEHRTYQDGMLYATQRCARCGTRRDVICREEY